MNVIIKKENGKVMTQFIGASFDAQKRDTRSASERLQKDIKIGTKLHIKTDNIKVEPHRGKYYILFEDQFELIYIFYVDVNDNLRFVYTGNTYTALNAIYNNIANETEVILLKSIGNKKAYRVFEEIVNNETNERCYRNIVMPYKNKSSKNLTTVYMTMFEAINLAAKEKARARVKNGVNIVSTFKVVSPKNTVFFEI